MDPAGQFARRFPLVARTRPACLPLARRVAELCDRARQVEHSGDLTEAAAVHNNAALTASDCGLPDLARQWCHQQVNIYLRARPLSAQVARFALEPITNLARLYIREGQGERAFALMDTLFTAVSARADAIVDGIEIPADLTDSAETNQHIRSWLWAVLLATGGRALAAADRWAEARARLDEYKGVGRRMLDGRQVAVIAHAVSGDTDSALALLADTTPGDPWENAVTACLTIQCHGASGDADLATLLNRYHGLDASAPGLAVFHTRLGLSFIDATGTVDDPSVRQIAVDLIDHATATRDGYVARDMLAHNGCRELLTGSQARELSDLVDASSRLECPERWLSAASSRGTVNLLVVGGNGSWFRTGTNALAELDAAAQLGQLAVGAIAFSGPPAKMANATPNWMNWPLHGLTISNEHISVRMPIPPRN